MTAFSDTTTTLDAVGHESAAPRHRAVRRHVKRRFLALVVIGLVPLVALTYVSVRLATGAVTDQVHARIDSTAAVGLDFVDEQTRGIADLVDSYATDTDTVRAFQGSGGRADTNALQADLGQLRRAHPGLVDALIVSRDGRIITTSPSDRQLIGRDVRGEEWFTALDAKPSRSVSASHPAITGNPQVVSIAAPLRTSAGASTGAGSDAVLGYVVAEYGLQPLRDFVTAFEDRGVALTITDQRGIVLAAPGLASGEVRDRSGDPQIAAALAGRAGRSGTHAGGNDRRALVSYLPVPSTGWTASASVPANTAYVAAADLRNSLLAITAFLSLVTFAAILLFARSTRRRWAAEDRLRAALSLEGQRLATLVDAQQEIATAGLETSGVLEAVVHRALEMTGGDGAIVELPEGDDLRKHAAAGTAADLPDYRLPVNASLSGRALRSGRLLICGNVEGDDRVEADSATSPGARSIIVVPLRHDDAGIGVLKVTADRAHAFGPTESRTLQVLAALASATLGDANAYAENRRVLDERTAAFRALEESRSLASTVLESLDEGVLLQDADQTILSANASAERILGLSVEQLRNRGSGPGWNLLKEDGTPMDPDARASALALTTMQAQRDQVTGLAHADGRVTWLSVNAYPLRHDPTDEPHAVVVSFQDITDRKLAEGQLREMALNDPLTGLPNRRVLIDRLEHALARIRRQGGRIGVLFVDLDRFKAINDSLGHEVGDELLKSVSRRLQTVLRPSDTAARLGGDEFVVVCEDLIDMEAAKRVAERIEKVLADPHVIGSEVLTVTASVGVVLGSSTSTSEELLRNADRAMYRAKEGGRSQYQVFNDAIAVKAIERLEIERDLRRALDSDQLTLYYQPVVDLHTGTMHGVEALLRWQHPHRGLVLPGEFIDIAEESGTIIPIGRWALVEACRQVANGLGTDNDDSLFLAVNVSARQAARVDFAETVRYALDLSGLDPARLSLELTESVLLEAASSTTSALGRLKELGVQLAIDDFGTGYSSLTYLRRFPVDAVKVDRSFVAGLSIERQDDAIVEAVINLGNTFALDVVAEGVEHIDQADRLREMGCTFAQGYFFGRPVPPEQLSS